MEILESVDNKSISQILDLSSKLLTLHNKEENKAKAFGAASFTIDRLTEAIAQKSEKEMLAIRGIGSTTVKAIQEIIEKGTLDLLEGLIAETPEGVLDLFKVKGLGVKKIKALWEELGIDNLNELRIACESGKIAKTKGFGEKTQESILNSLVFIQAQAGKLRMDKGAELARNVEAKLKEIFDNIELTGDVVSKNQVVNSIKFLISQSEIEKRNKLGNEWEEDMKASSPYVWRGYFSGNKTIVELAFIDWNRKGGEAIINTASNAYLSYRKEDKTFYHFLRNNSFQSEQEAYELFGERWVQPELRENLESFNYATTGKLGDLISWDKLKGTVHNHSTHSDGRHTLQQMAQRCIEHGWEYFGIADHSQTASYAGGLTPAEVEKQWQEIDELNKTLGDFRILKGIESDILTDGSLDYPDEILKGFDYVVASVHSSMNMTAAVATSRLVKAIENPHTTILGHPTGRLLLSRDGYPLNMAKVIDACAANGVVMELNASPYRLDIDWKWIPYCLEKNVMISINPDAHSMEGLEDMRYGAYIARKSLLPTQMTFNAMGLNELKAFLAKK